MEAQLAISYLLQRVQQETVLPIEVAVELEQQMVTAVLEDQA
jgi:antitoxin component of RelBE/YafQ-DinJ toxin-antitoxin module